MTTDEIMDLITALMDVAYAAATDSTANEERDPAIAAVRVTIEALQADAARLDYIASNARCDPKMDGNHVWWPTTFNHRLTGATLRDAIDAAMAKS